MKRLVYSRVQQSGPLHPVRQHRPIAGWKPREGTLVPSLGYKSRCKASDKAHYHRKRLLRKEGWSCKGRTILLVPTSLVWGADLSYFTTGCRLRMGGCDANRAKPPEQL